MRIAITGAGGFVGRWLAADLRSAGHEVLSSGTREPDVTDRSKVSAWLQSNTPDAVVHLAAIAFGPDAARDPGLAFDVNVGGMLAVLDAARTITPAPWVLVPSSGEVYGPPDADAMPFTEAAHVRPANAYALSKVAQESVALAIGARTGVPVFVTRAFNHSGPGQRTDYVVPALAQRVRAFARGDVPAIRVGNLDVARDFLDVRDVARAYRLLLEAASAGRIDPGTIVNVASGESISVRQIVQELCRLKGVVPKLDVDQGLVRTGEPADVRGDASRLRELVDWRPEIPFAQTLKEVLARIGERADDAASPPAVNCAR
jgi:GDP-4-dehydro-6-deoxy-D-mannose reductase